MVEVVGPRKFLWDVHLHASTTSSRASAGSSRAMLAWTPRRPIDRDDRTLLPAVSPQVFQRAPGPARPINKPTATRREFGDRTLVRPAVMREALVPRRGPRS